MSEQHGTNLGELNIAGKPWTDMKLNNSLIMDSLIKLVLGFMRYGMSDLGEVLEVASKLVDSDEERWINAWSDMGARLLERAEKAEKNGKLVSAADAYLRASTYYRFSLMCFAKPEDARMKEYVLTYKKCYAKYLEYSGYPGEVVKIPYENSFLPGYFYRSPVAKEKAPLLVITPGRDTFSEDTVWVYDSAIRRGIHCLIFDGPGQGAALRLDNLVFRPDWENVVCPVIDFGEKLPGVDPERIGSVGVSMGGFLAPRSAAFDKRIKICVADPGNLSWGGAIGGHLQKVATMPADMLPPQIKSLVSDYAWKHGVPNTVKDVIEVLKAYDYTSVVGNITCKTLVMDGTAEVTFGAAKNFYDALNCPKEYMLFDEKTTAQLHCQIGAPATASEYMFDWITDNL
ncbi:MAG TPA: alpha/beta fold hydrolase [Candidatus Nitrosotenuis sp.]|nr:alpha/beta fold hydrolase [Candidatus Nitrosotenuis sp.]